MTEDLRDDSGGLLIAIFSVSGEVYGVGAAHVQEITRVAHITRLHDAPESIIGVMNLRGRIVTIIDLAARLSIGQVIADEDSRIIIIAWSGEHVGLLVERAIDVLPVDADTITCIPANVSDSGSRFLSGVFPLDGMHVPILDIDAVLGQAEESFGAERAGRGS